MVLHCQGWAVMDTQVYCSLPWWDGPLYSHIVLDCILALFDFVYPMLMTVSLHINWCKCGINHLALFFANVLYLNIKNPGFSGSWSSWGHSLGRSISISPSLLTSSTQPHWSPLRWIWRQFVKTSCFQLNFDLICGMVKQSSLVKTVMDVQRR